MAAGRNRRRNAWVAYRPPHRVELTGRPAGRPAWGGRRAPQRMPAAHEPPSAVQPAGAAQQRCQTGARPCKEQRVAKHRLLLAAELVWGCASAAQPSHAPQLHGCCNAGAETASLDRHNKTRRQVIGSSQREQRSAMALTQRPHKWTASRLRRPSAPGRPQAAGPHWPHTPAAAPALEAQSAAAAGRVGGGAGRLTWARQASRPRATLVQAGNCASFVMRSHPAGIPALGPTQSAGPQPVAPAA